MGSDFHWDADKLSILRSMRKRGKSATEIAKRLGCTRNAVLGKTYRDKVPSGKIPNQKVTKRGQQVSDADLRWSMKIVGLRNTYDLCGYHHYSGPVNYLSSRRCLVAFLLGFKGYDTKAIATAINRGAHSIYTMKSAAKKMIISGQYKTAST